MMNKDYTKWMGARLRVLREAAGISRADVAKRLGYKSDTSIMYIETGRSLPRVQDLPVLAVMYGVGVEKILTGTVPVTDPPSLTECPLQYPYGGVCVRGYGHKGWCKEEGED